VTYKNKIDRFNGVYEFLSNFYPVEIITPNGRIFPSVEHAYQAAKSLDGDEIAWIQSAATPKLAKRRGRRVKQLRPNWNRLRVDIMWALLELKFSHPSLAAKLISTSPIQLVEGNSWKDTFWGVDSVTGLGQNRLGRLLMQVRDGLMEEQRPVRNSSSF